MVIIRWLLIGLIALFVCACVGRTPPKEVAPAPTTERLKVKPAKAPVAVPK